MSILSAEKRNLARFGPMMGSRARRRGRDAGNASNRERRFFRRSCGCENRGASRRGRVGDIAYRDLDRSNYAMFAAFAQLEGLAPMGLETLSAGVEACDRALRDGCRLVEVAAVRTLVALAQIEALEDQSGTHHHVTAHLKNDAINSARAFLGQPGWKVHERVQLLGLLAEAMSIRGDRLDRIAADIKKMGAHCTTPTTLQFYASSRSEHTKTMREALGLEVGADRADFPLTS
ncbi:MAG: hypothetical protein AAF605_01715 [Myxococcota bacterium]